MTIILPDVALMEVFLAYQYYLSELLTFLKNHFIIVYMDISRNLVEFGLNYKQASVYVACLQLGPSSVQSIAARAELKRPTTYLILDELVSKGLVSIIPREKKKLFVAESPEKLESLAENRFYKMKKMMPELQALYNTKAARPAVVLYQGKEAIRRVYEEIVATEEEEFLSFYSIENISEEFSDTFQYFIKMMKENPHKASREIVYTKIYNHYYLKTVSELSNHKIRFVSEKNRFFTDNIIYQNKVAIFSFAKRFVVIIESQDIADSFRSLFELAWNSAQELPKE